MKHRENIALEKGAWDTGWLAGVMGHEIGHAVQGSRGLRKGEQTPAIGTAMEVQAECLAARALAHVLPNALEGYEKVMRTVDRVSDTHGTPEARHESFNQGKSRAECMLDPTPWERNS